MKSPDTIASGQNHENQKNLVERIKKLMVPSSSKVDLILTWKGLKPATDITLGPVMPPIDPSDWGKILTETEAVFRDLGLQYVLNDREFPLFEDEHGNKEYPEYKEYLVAKTTEDLESLHKVNNITTDSSGNIEDIGRLYGFPETAVKGFVKEIANENYFADSTNRLPEDIKKQDYMAFSTFGLSKDHWQEELITVQKWAEEIKRTDPELYGQYVREYHENQKN